MVNQKQQATASSDFHHTDFQTREEKECKMEGVFLDEYATLSKYEMCKKKQKLSECKESIGFHEVTLDQSEYAMDSLIVRDFNHPQHVSCRYIDAREHFEIDRYSTQYMELIQQIAQGSLDVNVRDSTNQSPLHFAVRYGHHEMIEYLLRNGAIVDSQDIGGRTPLHVAASIGDVKTSELLLHCGANPRVKSHNGFDALFFAVQAGCTVLVEQLVALGCNVNELIADRDLNRQYSYLHCAVERNHVVMVQTLLHCKADVNLRDCYGSTSLHLASRYGRLEIARLLLAHGASVHEKDANQLTALYLTVSGGHREVFDLLLDRGANLNDQGTAGTSLLHLAIERDDLDFMAMLLSKGADVDATTRFGKTPLHYAIAKKNWTAFELLLQHGADINCREALGKTPLHSAIESRAKEVVLLLRHGANVNAKDKTLQTPLHSAVKQGCANTVYLLLQFGADVNAEDESRLTPLHCAVKHGHVHLFELLLRYRANIDVTDIDGNTPLHLAIASEHSKLLFVKPDFTFFASLLNHGADIRKRTRSTGETALHLAVSKKCRIFTWKLLQHGADVNSQKIKGRTPLHEAVENRDSDCVEYLLTFGADIERLDQDGKTPLDLITCGGITRVFVRHFIKRSIADLRVSPRLLRIANEEDETALREQCANEVKRMASLKMYDDVTYYDFLRGTRRSLVGFVKNREVIAIFEQQIHRTNFPIYANMLEGNFITGKRYEPFLDLATARLNAICNFQLPSVPVEKVLSYLNANDMWNLVNAIPNLPIVFDDRKM